MERLEKNNLKPFHIRALKSKRYILPVVSIAKSERTIKELEGVYNFEARYKVSEQKRIISFLKSNNASKAVIVNKIIIILER